MTDLDQRRFSELRDALRDVLSLIDDGYLVRNISSDHSSDWAMKQLAPVMILQRARKLVDE